MVDSQEKPGDNARAEPADDSAGPEAVRAPETDAEKQRKEKQRDKPIKIFGIELPPFISRPLRDLGEAGMSMRRSAIRATPRPIVNNSASFIGAIHLTSELAMFKSNGSMLVSPEHKGSPLHILIDPPRNVWRSVTSRAKFNVKLSDLKNPKFYKDSFGTFTNLEKASALDRQASINEQVARGANPLHVTPELVNQWQARSTFAGLVGWGINMITPNAKEKPEDIEKMTQLAKANPLMYVGECVRRAIWFPVATLLQLGHKIVTLGQGTTDDGIGRDKRYFTGLLIMFSGICSFLGGFRNVAKPAGTLQKYFFNWQYCATGTVTFLSSLPLLFAPDNNRGYSQFGLIHIARLGFLPGSILKKFQNADKGVSWYVTGHAGLQSENIFAALVGGATKRADGTIVDHQVEHKEADQDKPSTSVTAVTDHQMNEQALQKH